MVAPQRPGKARHLLEIVDRHDARNDRRPDAARTRRLEKAQVVRVVEEELRDDARRARIDLGLEVVEVGGDVGTVGMLLGIAGNGNIEVADLLEAAHQVGRIGVAAGMRTVRAAHTGRRIAAQGNDVVHAGRLVGVRHLVDLAPCVACTQVRCAAGTKAVSRARRATVVCVRSRVEPPAP